MIVFVFVARLFVTMCCLDVVRSASSGDVCRVSVIYRASSYNSCAYKDEGIVVCSVVDFVGLFCPADGETAGCPSFDLLHTLASHKDLLVTGQVLI
jgi:hypothetical protein